MNVTEIHFNHDTTSASSDAINMRMNASGFPIQAPEWQQGQTPKPATHAMKALGSTITVKAKFRDGPPNGSRIIRAVDARIRFSNCSLWDWFIDLIKALFGWFFGYVLGDVKPKSVSFDAAGNSNLQTFTLSYQRVRSRGVGIYYTDWIWQYRSRCKGFPWMGTWVTFDKTYHKTFVIVDMPQGPWDQSTAGNNTQLPWADALDKACVWAMGAKSKDKAAERITKSINTQSNQSYTPATIFGFTPPYHLTSYMNHLDSAATFSLNCTDCADAVTTFSNLLGCDLWEGRFFDMVTRKFLTLNGNPAVEADWVSWGWSYHEICWLSVIEQNAFIYDGCLQVDMDNDYSDLVHIAKHPVKMRFGMSDPGDYRYRLIESGTGNLENIPRRRSVD